VLSVTPQPLSALKIEPPYPLNKRLGGPHRMAEHLEKEKIPLPLPEIKPLQ